MTPLDIVSQTDIGDMLGILPSAVSMARQRDATFPEPVALVSRGGIPLFARADVIEWARRTGRLDRLEARMAKLERRYTALKASRDELAGE